MKHFFITLLCVVVSFAAVAQLQSPDAFLGYRIGDKFTPHHRVVDYFRHVAAQASNQVKLVEYGTSYEGRPLIAAIVSSAANMSRLEEIRRNNLQLTGLLEGQGNINAPVIVWMSYNVHGNEAVSTEAVMLTLHELLTQRSEWLNDAVVILDPCANPDGHSRYVNWYIQMKGATHNVQPDAREHYEPWPGGRYNHYIFDLNRDWAWQSQQETRQRLAFYQQWMPQVHGDFHEMGPEQPYYFAPAAEPYHKEITNWQREFQVVVGKNAARYFDRNKWLYFTRETFDLLYPSYGDTWPTYNGAIGMTYEQGGSGRAGLGILLNNGDTLTLRKRIDHQHTSGIATIEAAAQQKSRMMQEFKNYFEQARTNPGGTYKSFIIPAGNDAYKVKMLTDYLDRNQIRYGLAGTAAPVKAFNFQTGKEETVTLSRNDLVISTVQPKSVLVKVLFNPRTVLADSVTYDATAWSLPYAMGLQAYASAERIAQTAYTAPAFTKNTPVQGGAYAYLSAWKNFGHARLLAALMKAGINVRFAEQPFSMNGISYDRGALMISRADNTHIQNFDKVVTDVANAVEVAVQGTASGLSSTGIDLGSSSFQLMKAPRIALISGDGVYPTSFGEAWNYFDYLLEYPVTVINSSMLNRIDWNKYDVVILPAGSYNSLDINAVKSWMRNGGRLIAMENAMNVFADKEGFLLKTKKDDKGKDEKPKPEEMLKKYGERERNSLTNGVEGSIFRANMDVTHPLAFGYQENYHTLKHINNFYEYLNGGWNVGVLKSDAYVDGFVGSKAKEKLKNSLVFGVENIGGGALIYLADSPIYRHSWQNGYLLFSNAIFFVGQ
ncbi:M14 family metallopeptidase [Rhodoflexus caldus]|uniref:M14 family metallopeptidase n=1 Tax=Rhodoflexus caldus TaxID=2891236 RepID=UPI00202ABB48|nr:M14 family metallopeptidase [Rhodoflexus caldus]